MKFLRCCAPTLFLAAWCLTNVCDAAEARNNPSTNRSTRAEAPSVSSEPETFQPIGTGIIRQDNVNVRGQATVQSEIVTRLKKGEVVTLFEEVKNKRAKGEDPANWFRIAMPANTPVWVNAGFVDWTNNVVSARRLNVRSGAGERFSVVARLSKGDAVKEIRRVNDWVEIEAPTNAFSFIASEFITRQQEKPPVVDPIPAPEITQLPATTNMVAAATSVTAPPAQTPETLPSVDAATPSVQTPAPAPPIALKTEEPAQKRVVAREGVVMNALSPQAPAPFLLVHEETGKTINYISAGNSPYQLRLYLGTRVIITGEEVVDPRWPKTPVIAIETLDLP